MKRILIFAEAEYEDMELQYPKFRMKEAGFEVIVAGGGQPAYYGKKGYPVVVNAHIRDINPADFDGLIIPGGWAPDRLRRYKDALDIVRYMDEKNLPIGAICHGQQVMISAGILKNRRITCFKAIKDDVINAGALFEDAAVVVDRNLITSRTPEDLHEFCPAFIRCVEEMK